ncbi:MAG TPA: TolC family protein [Acidobacteriaceae bacterium]|nr:TolC family protein [Acidobacteriaceae bacterium]
MRHRSGAGSMVQKTLPMLCAAGLLVSTTFAQTNPAGPLPPAPAGPQQSPPKTIAQQAQAAAQPQPVAYQGPFHIELPHSRNPLARYMPSTVPPLNLQNSQHLYDLMRDGKLRISLQDAIALALENNLTLASFRYNFPIAQADLQRTKAGGVVNGVNTNITQTTPSGFGASGGGGGSANSSSAAAGAGGIVTSTLGAGPPVPSFDPFLNFSGFVNHSVIQEPNIFLVGTPILKTNNIEVVSTYTQYFPLGTGLQVNYIGQRLASNGPYNAVNPELFSSLQVYLSQPLLYGFGLASNERYIHIAKRNLQTTDLAFEQQVIATVKDIESLYWDLVNAYQDVQVKTRSLAYANQTLTDDQKQLELQNIPALQVMKDQSAVATSEGDLTIAKATLRHNELLIKDDLTRTDDPSIDEIPVIPLDLQGGPDPNESKSITQLIDEAMKNRPEVAIFRNLAEVQRQSLKDINSELLPQLNLFGYYQGAGTAGPKNPYCSLGPAECTTDLPTDFPSMLQNTFNYSSPTYEVGVNLQINLRNRVVKADQFRAVLAYRQSQISQEQQQKSLRFDIRDSQFALEQAQARVAATQKARDLAQKTFDIAKQEQNIGAMSRYDTLVAEEGLAVAESAFFTAQTAYEKAKADIDRATGTTLDRTGVSIDDARSGVVTHARP